MVRNQSAARLGRLHDGDFERQCDSEWNLGPQCHIEVCSCGLGWVMTSLIGGLGVKCAARHCVRVSEATLTSAQNRRAVAPPSAAFMSPWWTRWEKTATLPKTRGRKSACFSVVMWPSSARIKQNKTPDILTCRPQVPSWGHRHFDCGGGLGNLFFCCRFMLFFYLRSCTCVCVCVWDKSGYSAFLLLGCRRRQRASKGRRAKKSPLKKERHWSPSLDSCHAAAALCVRMCVYVCVLRNLLCVMKARGGGSERGGSVLCNVNSSGRAKPTTLLHCVNRQRGASVFLNCCGRRCRNT